MYQKVYLTEKDSQVEALAPILGCKYTKKWHPAYNEDKSIAIIPLQGHLMELLKYPEEYDESYKKWEERTVICFPKQFKVQPKGRTINLLNRAISHLKDTKEVIIASDFDNEGASLAMRVIEYAGAEDKVSHMLHMGSMDEKALTEAVNNPIDIPYRNMANAGYARAYIDWAEGMSYTRGLSLFLAKGQSLVLFGGVKTPLLNMIVERDIQFEEHKSIKHYTISGTCSAKGSTFEYSVFKKEGGKKIKEFETNELAIEVANKIKDKDFELSLFTSKNKTENSPQLFDLTSLQAEMSRKFNLSPDQVLDVAQKLYDQFKIQTYPRTAIKYLHEKEYDAVPRILTKLSTVMHADVIGQILSGPIPKRSSVFNSQKVTSHGALAPTEGNITKEYSRLNQYQKEGFNIVATRYIANFMPPYEFKANYGEVHLFDDYYLSFSENIPLKAGYKKLYQPNIDETINNYKQVIPDLSKVEQIHVNSTEIKEGESKPKPRFTMETLLKGMENIANLYPNDKFIKEQLGENGIGTPATRSSIIKELLEVKKEGEEPWIIQKGKQIISTERARKMIKSMPQDIASVVKRAKLNQELSKIEKGDLTIEEFLDFYREDLQKNIEAIKEHAKNPENIIAPKKKEVVSLGKCPVCKEGHIYDKGKVFMCTSAIWKKDDNEKWTNEGCQYSIFKGALKKLGGKDLSKTDIKTLLKKGKIPEFRLVSAKTGNEYKKDLLIDEKYGVKVDFNSGEQK